MEDKMRKTKKISVRSLVPVPVLLLLSVLISYGGNNMTNGTANDCSGWQGGPQVSYTYPDNFTAHGSCDFATFPLISGSNPPGEGWVTDGIPGDCASCVFPPQVSHANDNDPDNWGGATIYCGDKGGTTPQTPAE